MVTGKCNSTFKRMVEKKPSRSVFTNILWSCELKCMPGRTEQKTSWLTLPNFSAILVVKRI